MNECRSLKQAVNIGIGKNSNSHTSSACIIMSRTSSTEFLGQLQIDLSSETANVILAFITYSDDTDHNVLAIRSASNA